MNILIFGSCVTRDIFRGDFYNGKDNITIDKYYARNSLISLNSEPIDIDVSDVVELDPFQRRLLSDDLNKNFYTYIRDKNGSRYLMVDFIDERFHLFQWGENYLTRSNEFIKAGLADRIEGKVISRFTEDTTLLWKKNCLIFFGKIQPYFESRQIILHRALWKKEYIDRGTVVPFQNQDEIKKQNAILNTYYDFFEENCPGLTVLDLNKQDYLADNDHIWGLGEMHYEQRYYDACMEFLISLDRQSANHNGAK